MDPVELRRKVGEYVRDRLTREVRGHRGKATEVAKAAKITTAHISNLTAATPGRNVGDEVLHKMASYWGLTYSALERLAVGEMVEEGIDSLYLEGDPYRYRRELRHLSEWQEASAEARRKVLAIANKYGDHESVADWLAELKRAQREIHHENVGISPVFVDESIPDEEEGK